MADESGAALVFGDPAVAVKDAPPKMRVHLQLFDLGVGLAGDDAKSGKLSSKGIRIHAETTLSGGTIFVVGAIHIFCDSVGGAKELAELFKM
jgi:hypothetical protein